MGMHGGVADWEARLEEFLNDCVGSMVTDQAARLRDAETLFVSDARPRSELDASARRETVRGLIEADAAVDAALAIIGEETAFMLSRGGSGTCLATMILPEGSEEVMGEAATPALALLAAYAAALISRAGLDTAAESARTARAGARLH